MKRKVTLRRRPKLNSKPAIEVPIPVVSDADLNNADRVSMSGSVKLTKKLKDGSFFSVEASSSLTSSCDPDKRDVVKDVNSKFVRAAILEHIDKLIQEACTELGITKSDL